MTSLLGMMCPSALLKAAGKSGEIGDSPPAPHKRDILGKIWWTPKDFSDATYSIG